MHRTRGVFLGFLVLMSPGCAGAGAAVGKGLFESAFDCLGGMIFGDDSTSRHSDQQLNRMGYERDSKEHRALIAEEDNLRDTARR